MVNIMPLNVRERFRWYSPLDLYPLVLMMIGKRNPQRGRTGILPQRLEELPLIVWSPTEVDAPSYKRLNPTEKDTDSLIRTAGVITCSSTSLRFMLGALVETCER